MLITQALYTLTLVWSESLLLDHTRFVSLKSVMAAFPIRLLSSLWMDRLSVMVDPRYTNSWMTSSCIVVVDLFFYLIHGNLPPGIVPVCKANLTTQWHTIFIPQLSTAHLISLSQFLMAHLSQRHGPCMDDKFHHAITQFYITALYTWWWLVGWMIKWSPRIHTKETLNYPVYYNLSLCYDSLIIIILLV